MNSECHLIDNLIVALPNWLFPGICVFLGSNYDVLWHQRGLQEDRDYYWINLRHYKLRRVFFGSHRKLESPTMGANQAVLVELQDQGTTWQNDSGSWSDLWVDPPSEVWLDCYCMLCELFWHRRGTLTTWWKHTIINLAMLQSIVSHVTLRIHCSYDLTYTSSGKSRDVFKTSKILRIGRLSSEIQPG